MAVANRVVSGRLVQAPQNRHDAPQPAQLGVFDPQLDVSIIILNWNTLDLLRDCLTSIRETAGSLRLEIIIVDNGSHDGSVEALRREFADYRLIANERNLGFARANNQGLREAHGRYLLLLNSDTIVLPHALQEMVRYLDEHASVAVVGPHLLNDDRSTQISVFPFAHVLQDSLVILEINRWPLVKRLARWYGRRRDQQMMAQTGTVDYVLGACMLFRREALEQVGVLDDRYFFGGEDMDLCYRLRKGGWSTVYVATSQIIHLHGASRHKLTATYLMWYYAGRLQFYAYHKPRWQYRTIRAALALASVGHMVALYLSAPHSSRNRSMLSGYAHLLMRVVKS
jgi:N-acetylglucosaminyl-diphospho-decaprenol L-rhamnosyltransferase